MFFSMIISN